MLSNSDEHHWVMEGQVIDTGPPRYTREAQIIDGALGLELNWWLVECAAQLGSSKSGMHRLT